MIEAKISKFFTFTHCIIYFKFKVEEKTYKVKRDLHNTTCVLGVYGVGNNNSDKVDGKSVAEFFVEQYLLKVVHTF